MPAFAPAVEPHSLTTTVTHLVYAIRPSSAFDQLPVLADALQDAGCDAEELLRHCRHDTAHGPHCWAIGAVLAVPPPPS
ncbi:hypothetical protein GobsT_75260 [Gemmata obscuriglobus]|uniref:hypothetical protein n=1 Tax=Gemmata obscuriglobus TaxID=114 RepID=UPI00030F1F26|nr:hypothetical protein [Gemmata obscuriglobus]QEG32668.1 hypothetical protein GobsT_75260 [Gemmata obscuriglobus]VTS12024.1 unnamed protein product [Gemmata obscuriglobus UQM 2246]